MKILVNNLKSRIITDNSKLLEALCNLYTFKVPGAEFTPAYQQKRWDGKKRFISQKGVFRTGLLSRILTDLKKVDCEPEIESSILPSTYNNYDTIPLKEIKFYPFQKQFVDRALTEKRGIIKAPCGAGKSLVLAGIINSLPYMRKGVILFNTKQLVKQTYDFLTQTCKMPHIGFCTGEGIAKGNVMLSTVQSIDRILDSHLEKSKWLFADEIHEFCKGKITLAAIQSFPNAIYRFGFTATPPKDPISLYNLEGAIGPIWEITTTTELIEEGKLAKPIITVFKIKNEDWDGKSYSEIYDEYIVNNEKRNDKIYEQVGLFTTLSSYVNRILIIVSTLEHVAVLKKLLPDAITLEGKNSLSERYEGISKFLNSKQSTVLIGTKILQAGVNIEEITHFINARGLKSEILTIQALGRSLRKHPSKKRVQVIDFYDEGKYLENHSRNRIKHYESEGHRVTIV